MQRLTRRSARPHRTRWRLVRSPPMTRYPLLRFAIANTDKRSRLYGMSLRVFLFDPRRVKTDRLYHLQMRRTVRRFRKPREEKASNGREKLVRAHRERLGLGSASIGRDNANSVRTGWTSSVFQGLVLFFLWILLCCAFFDAKPPIFPENQRNLSSSANPYGCAGSFSEDRNIFQRRLHI